MKRFPRYALAAALAILLAAAFLVTFASCAHVPAPVASCAADPSLAVEVAADLASFDYVNRLEQLVARVGLCIVNRTVESVISPSGAKADAELVAHGRAWLAAHPLTAAPSPSRSPPTRAA